MRWSIVFGYLSSVLVVALLLSLPLGWTGWLLLIAILLLAPLVVGLGIAYRNSVSWSSILSYLSVAALLAAVVSEYLHSTTGRNWFLMAWTVLLLGPAIKLFSHPMRGPAWGLFIGFWGVVAVLWLIVLQALVIAGVLGGSAYTDWAAWPLAVVGIWLLVASGTGFGAERFPIPVDVLGLITGAALLATSVAMWAGSVDLMRSALVVAGIAYCRWAAGLGWVASSVERPHRLVPALTTQRVTPAGQ